MGRWYAPSRRLYRLETVLVHSPTIRGRNLVGPEKIAVEAAELNAKMEQVMKHEKFVNIEDETIEVSA